MDIELVTDPDACMMYIVSPLAGLGWRILWRPPAYSVLFIRASFYVLLVFIICVVCLLVVLVKLSLLAM